MTDYHLDIPKDLAGNLAYRERLLRLCREKPEFRPAVMEMCRRDFTFWVNAWVWQYNPNSIGDGSLSVGPFVTWEFQDAAAKKIIACIDDRKDGVIEKSREMGASWLCLLIMDWYFLFHPWKKFLCISRNEHAVDKPGDADSLFWKLDFVHDHLPDWMVGCDRTAMRRKMGFRHPVTHSSITGQASTGKAGVGGRATAMFIDEFSQIAEAYEVLQRTSDTTGCRLFNGTHLGMGGAFYDLCDPASAVGSFVRKIRMHWTQHPDKVKGLYRYRPETNAIEVLDKTYEYPPDFEFVYSEEPTGGPFPGLRSPWYDDQCKRKGSKRAVACDLDIAPAEADSMFFNPIQLRELRRAYCCDPFWQGDLRYDKDSMAPLGLEALGNGPIKLWLSPTHDGVPAGKYAFGADVATGLGATNTCLSGVNARTGEKVFEFASSDILPEDFAAFMVAVCKLFKDEDGQPARLAWEHAGPGLLAGKRVVDSGFRNFFCRDSVMTVGKGKVANVPGWHPTIQTKRILLERYRAALYARQFVNRSSDAMDECRFFRYSSDGKAVEHSQEMLDDDPTGARDNHGDRVIGDALAQMLCEDMGLTGVRSKPQSQVVPSGSLAHRRQIRQNQRDKADAWS